MFVGPKIIQDDLILTLDFGSDRCYPNSGTDCYNLNYELGAFSGSLINGPTVSQDGGGSLEFDGVNDHIRFYKDDINPGGFTYDYCTIYCWVKPSTSAYSTSGTGANIITLENVVEISIGDNSNGYSKLYYASNPWAWYGTTDDVLTNGEWNLVTLTHSQNSRVLYVNGESVFSRSDSGALANGRSDMAWVTLMGRFSGTSSNVPGNLANVKMYSSVHTQSQIQYQFNKERSRFGV